MANARTWNPPADFTTWAIVETLPQLMARYERPQTTIYEAVMKLPAHVLEARDKCIRTRTAAVKRKPGVRERKKYPTPTYRDSYYANEDSSVRNATKAFEAAYCDVADRRGWLIRGYAA